MNFDLKKKKKGAKSDKIGKKNKGFTIRSTKRHIKGGAASFPKIKSSP